VAIAPRAGSAAVAVRSGKTVFDPDIRYQTALISRVAAMRIAAPPNIETAYERA
jgi:hypothetical protein